jgi:hypothetical protein
MVAPQVLQSLQRVGVETKGNSRGDHKKTARTFQNTPSSTERPPEEGPRHSRRLKELILFTRVRIVTSNPEENNNMRLILTMALVAAAISTAAMAQPANRDANTPAVNTPNSPPNPGAPVAGANSFTEGQAKSRIESSGYTNISELRKDDQGVWRGKAMKDGKAVSISLDFQGNVTAQ